MIKKKICLNCGKIYIDKNKKNVKKNYCSKYCGRRYRRKTGDSLKGKMIKKTCLMCGNIFYINYTQLTGKNQNPKFCSKKCSNQAKRYQRRNKGKLLQKYICMGCGKRVIKGFSRLNKYCSRECYDKHKIENGRKSLICDTCDKSFFRTKSQIKKCLNRKQKKFYCSKKCFLKRNKNGNKRNRN